MCNACGESAIPSCGVRRPDVIGQLHSHTFTMDSVVSTISLGALSVWLVDRWIKYRRERELVLASCLDFVCYLGFLRKSPSMCFGTETQ